MCSDGKHFKFRNLLLTLMYWQIEVYWSKRWELFSHIFISGVAAALVVFVCIGVGISCSNISTGSKDQQSLNEIFFYIIFVLILLAQLVAIIGYFSLVKPYNDLCMRNPYIWNMRRGIVTYMLIFGVTILLWEGMMIAYAIGNSEWIDESSFESYDSEA